MPTASNFAEWIEGLVTGSGGRKLSPTQIAAYAGVSASTIVNWRRGAEPKPESLRKLAEALRVEQAELLQLAGYLPKQAVGTSRGDANGATQATMPAQAQDAIRKLAEMALAGVVRMVPVQRTWAHAGDGAEDARAVYVPPQLADKNVAAFEVQGSCMEPVISQGDIVFVDLDGSPRDRGLVVVHVDDRVLIRTYDAKAGMLVALNGEPPIAIGEAEDIAPIKGIYKDV